VSRSVAERLFPGRSAVGQAINLGPPPPGEKTEIVGVINDVTLYNVKRGSNLIVLVPIFQDPQPNFASVIVRGVASVDSLRRAVSSLGREYVFGVRTLEQIAQSANPEDRLAAIVGAAFGRWPLCLLRSASTGC
jgi:hypothetical protein